MNTFSLGIICSLQPDPNQALAQVAELGLTHVQVGYPEALDNPDGVTAVLAAAAAHKIAITTVFCGFSGERYDDIPTVRATVGLIPAATRTARVQKISDISRFAERLGVNRVAAHIGFVPEQAGPDRDELRAVLQAICDELAQRGQVFALETGQETALGLKAFIEDVARPNLTVNFDPANMILYGNDQPIPATELLFPWIDGVHCKDGCWPTEKGKLGEEKPWGEGDVNAHAWILRLRALGYTGPLTIEREISGPQQKADVIKARELLEVWLGA